MAITVGTTASQEDTSPTTVTLAVTCNGVDRYLGVFVGGFIASGDPAPSSATYAGVDLTPIFSHITFGAGSQFWMFGYRLVNPASGTNNLVINFTATPNRSFTGAIPMEGVNQVTPDSGTGTEAVGESGTASIAVPSAVGSLVWDGMISFWVAGANVGADQIQRWQIADLGEGVTGAGSTEPGAAPNVTMSWTRIGAIENSWGIGGISVNPAADSGIVFTSLPLLGVGR